MRTEPGSQTLIWKVFETVVSQRKGGGSGMSQECSVFFISPFDGDLQQETPSSILGDVVEQGAAWKLG